MRQTPYARMGAKIGLLGGSFDPAHEGHVHITRWALRRFRLDEVWWLVSPGNPLKDRGPAEMTRRIEAAEAIAPARKVVVTDIEAHLETRYTADTLAGMRRLYPGVRFVWLMGADNLAQFHLWEDWRWIMESFPIGVLARPGLQIRAGLSPAARRYRRWRLPKAKAGRLAAMKAPAWALLTGAMSSASSTEIRERGEWP
ncbi:MAG: nicotinate-nucleotide adenylyltransferase [Pseudomonadota bacterium]